jgi:hypothetical protein
VQWAAISFFERQGHCHGFIAFVHHGCAHTNTHQTT